MALRGVWQLKKLVVSYCDFSGSSRGTREFIEKLLPAFKEKNPQLEVETQLHRGNHPWLKGFYVNHRDRVVGVKNLDSEEVMLQATRLRSSIGRKVIKLRTRVITHHPSVQVSNFLQCQTSSSPLYATTYQLTLYLFWF